MPSRKMPLLRSVRTFGALIRAAHPASCWRNMAGDFSERSDEKIGRNAGRQPDLQRGVVLPLVFTCDRPGGVHRSNEALESWQDKLSEIGQLCELTFAMNELSAKLEFQFLDRLRQRGLRHVALFGGAREVQKAGNRHEISYLMQLHGFLRRASVFDSSRANATFWVSSAGRPRPVDRSIGSCRSKSLKPCAISATAPQANLRVLFMSDLNK